MVSGDESSKSSVVDPVLSSASETVHSSGNSSPFFVFLGPYCVKNVFFREMPNTDFELLITVQPNCDSQRVPAPGT